MLSVSCTRPSRSKSWSAFSTILETLCVFAQAPSSKKNVREGLAPCTPCAAAVLDACLVGLLSKLRPSGEVTVRTERQSRQRETMADTGPGPCKSRLAYTSRQRFCRVSTAASKARRTTLSPRADSRPASLRVGARLPPARLRICMRNLRH